ncbi:hypothetical protein, partial [Gracilimonas sp.]|uniref:hypothetical protein n=1 Tax=Gracilimonas sp. TaxID=1974203 RepID=UPI00287282F2|nr:hypothetical protein [Gracilimonas sp.]
MKKFNLSYYIKSVFTLLLLVSFTAACSNSTSGEEEEHSDPEGFVLKMNGQIIVEQLPGESITGEFELAPGEETDLITIFFLDDDGDEFQPDEEEVSLGVEFDESGIAEFEQHSEDGKWSFHLHAESEGITDMRLMLMHGDHSDFTTQDIHVHVEALNN